MLPLHNGLTLLDHNIKKASSCDRTLVVVHFRDEVITSYLDRKGYDIEIVYQESLDRGMLGAIEACREHVDDDYMTFLSDEFSCPVKVKDAIKYYSSSGADVLIGVVNSPVTYTVEMIPYGVFRVNKLSSTSSYMGTGMCIFKQDTIDKIGEVSGHDIEDFINHLLKEEYKAILYPIAERYFNINTWRDYERLIYHLMLRGKDHKCKI